MESRWCNACGTAFLPRPQAPRQSYCTQPQCQKERRRLWQQAKRRSDPDYLSNQVQAQKAWTERNPAYWRNYREEHPTYTQKNRLKQRARNERTGFGNQGVDPSAAANASLSAGVYELRRIDSEPGRKMDVWIVRLTPLSGRRDIARVAE